MSFDINYYLCKNFFSVPPYLIAQVPLENRGDSKLLVLQYHLKQTNISNFPALNFWLPPKAALIFNETKVTPARLLGQKSKGSGQVEALILSPPPLSSESGLIDLWCLAKPGKKLKIGTELFFKGTNTTLEAVVLDIDSDGHRLIQFNFTEAPAKVLEKIGHLPLPPYIHRKDQPEDFNRYQTVYATKPGAIAAPTAGLHFTLEHLQNLKEANHPQFKINLRVGAGTFAPLTEEQFKSGKLHEEYVEVTEETVDGIKKAKSEGRSIIAVGTTTARALEWAARDGELKPFQGLCDLFIRPGYNFKVIDGLITNFHLPGSSLLMLVAALAGQENIKKAYEQAIEENFRFYSYGDAMLII